MEEIKRALAPLGSTVVSVAGKGRGLVSTKDFYPGDVIISQAPYSSSPKKVFGSLNCDRCFVENGLRTCSGCRIAKYCGSTCQKLEWSLHRLECQALKELNDDRRKMLTSSIRVVVRLILRRKLQDDKIIPTTALDNFELVDALESHMRDLDEQQLLLYAQMANLVNLVLPSLSINVKETAQLFAKLSCNAHTICDSELRPLGTGLYPVISIINHSCVPNAVLVFEGHTAVVRALKPIHQGTEVVISYIETAATTKKRQEDLKQYFFSCTCSHCAKDPYDEMKETAILEGYRCRDWKCDGFLFLEPNESAFTCQRCGVSRDQSEIKKLSAEVAELTERASSLSLSGHQYEASCAYKTIEQLQRNLCHEFSVSLMQTRDTLVKILMEQKDWEGALTYCELSIPVYQRLYPAVHPMPGLQYYTCGKLEWLLERTEDALRSFIKAVDILRITHGTNTPFMRDLMSKLEEARAEASYKLAAIHEGDDKS